MGQVQLRQTANGIGVFVGPNFRTHGVDSVPFLKGLLTQRITDRLYEALSQQQAAFSVVQMPASRKRDPPVLRVCVGPLALLNTGCSRHARIVCRTRKPRTAWRVAHLLPGGALKEGQELLTSYADSAADWRCPHLQCGARL